MKKLIKSLFTLVLCFTCVLALTSCSKPELDFDDAKDNLESADYVVTLREDDDDLEPNVETRLSAFGDDDEFLYIIEFKDLNSARIYYKTLKFELKSEKKSIKLEIKELEHLLKKYEDDLSSDEIDDIEDEIKDLEKELEEMNEDYVMGMWGKVVWYGTAEAVDDSK